MRILAAIAVACSLAVPLRAAQPTQRFDPEVARRITPDEVQRRNAAGEKPIILDTRSSLGDTIAQGAVHVTNDRIESWAKDKPKDALIVTYCT
jgi:rhodanese-related sulfurtransferase